MARGHNASYPLGAPNELSSAFVIDPKDMHPVNLTGP